MKLALAGIVAALFTGATLPGIPKDVQPYRSWFKVNAKPIRDGSSAHPGLKTIYASKRAVRNRYPLGATVVKEGRDADGWVSLIAVMRKRAGSDPAHGNWRFVEYVRNGPKERFREIARDAVCWSCHVGAKKTDWVFTTR